MRSLDLARAVDDIACQAKAYKTLGSIFRRRGEDSAARLLWRDSRQMFERIGMAGKVSEIEALLGSQGQAARA
jgi:hypothetical protein